ncbi:MAG: outer membrane beta-barrel protein [Melioribacteraceae bacterium]|nr:outer membrane beta-barrel protein [Melioribacteraceae bacterium]
MKNKIIFTLLLGLLLVSSSNAQSPFRAGASFLVIFPNGNYTKLAYAGVGGSLDADYSISPKWSILLSSTYSSLTSKIPQIGIDSKAIDFSIKRIDILAGVRYNFNYSFFVIAKSGLSYLKLHANIYDSPSNSKDNVSSDYEPYFTTAFGGGYRYNLAKDKSDFEFSAIYNYTNGDIIDFNTFQLKASLLVYL